MFRNDGGIIIRKRSAGVLLAIVLFVRNINYKHDCLPIRS